MNINLNRRCFLKKSIISFVFVLFFFNKKYSFYIKGRRIENLELIKNFNFAKKKYHQETINLIFRGFLNKKNSSMNIVYNIEKRRKLSNLIYKKNIKFLI